MAYHFDQEVTVLKAYLITTGAVFALLALVHLWRVIVEWPHVVRDPFFLLITVLAAGLAVWALRLLLSNRQDAT